MKNSFIRILSLLLAICILTPVTTIATDTGATTVWTFEYEDRTIEIEANNITYDQAKMLADKIVYEEDGVSECGILCIFGHKLDTTGAIETTHKEYSSDPRCVRRSYTIEYCTRSSCSYSDATMTSEFRISCCD